MLYTTQPFDYVVSFADEDYPGDTMLVKPGTVLEVDSPVPYDLFVRLRVPETSYTRDVLQTRIKFLSPLELLALEA